jgi:hypothetical protein
MPLSIPGMVSCGDKSPWIRPCHITYSPARNVPYCCFDANSIQVTSAVAGRLASNRVSRQIRNITTEPFARCGIVILPECRHAVALARDQVRLQTSNFAPIGGEKDVTSALGQKRTFKRLDTMSALPPKADITITMRRPHQPAAMSAVCSAARSVGEWAAR